MHIRIGYDDGSFCNGLAADAFAEPATSLDYRARFIIIFISIYTSTSIHNFHFITFLAPVFFFYSFIRWPYNGVKNCSVVVVVENDRFMCKILCVCVRRRRAIDVLYSLSLIHLFISHRQCLLYCLLNRRKVLLPSDLRLLLSQFVLVYTQTLLTCFSIVCHTFVLSANCDFSMYMSMFAHLISQALNMPFGHLQKRNAERRNSS